eukprot:3659012-Rhodomonas_salina.1
MDSDVYVAGRFRGFEGQNNDGAAFAIEGVDELVGYQNPSATRRRLAIAGQGCARTAFRLEAFRPLRCDMVGVDRTYDPPRQTGPTTAGCLKPAE